MAFDPTPWFVDGGAEHSVEVARTLAYVATGGAEGVAAPGDWKVAALPVPGGAVRVAPGAGAILCRAAGMVSQSYVGRSPDFTDVVVAATGSGAGRTDLIAVIVEDPFVPGSSYPVPTDPVAGVYIGARVIPNVPTATTRLQDVPGWESASGYALARVTLPASTGTITSAMITDLRSLLAARVERDLVVGTIVTGTDLTSTSYVKWPNYEVTVKVPEWATRLTLSSTLISQVNRVAQTAGNLRALLRGPDATTAVCGQRVYWVPFNGASHLDFTWGGQAPIPPAWRGKTITIEMQGNRATGNTGHLEGRGDGQVQLDLEWSEVLT